MKISKELAKGSTAMVVLSVLAEEEMYGYRIIQEIAARSEEVFSMNEGTLYPILHAMEKEGMLESYMAESEVGRKRRYYKITPGGLLYLKEKKAEWRLFAASVDKVIGEA